MTIKTKDFNEKFLEPLWNQKSSDLIDEYVLPQAPIQTTFLSGIGPSVLKEKVKCTFDAFSNFKFKMISVSCTQNEVFYTWQGQGEHTGTLWPFKASFKAITFQGVASGQLERGFISRFSSFSNLSKILSLGFEQKPHQNAGTENDSKALSFDWQPLTHAIQKFTGNRLTRREIECLKLWINGYSIKETARILDDISMRTVQTFRENLKRKLSVKTYHQLLKLIQQMELMPVFLRTNF